MFSFISVNIFFYLLNEYLETYNWFCKIMNHRTFCREITKETVMRMRKVQELLDPEWQPVVPKKVVNKKKFYAMADSKKRKLSQVS